jgi:hypothetical protein
MYQIRSMGFKNSLYKTITNGIFLAVFLHLQIYKYDRDKYLAIVEI